MFYCLCLIYPYPRACLPVPLLGSCVYIFKINIKKQTAEAGEYAGKIKYEEFRTDRRDFNFAIIYFKNSTKPQSTIKEKTRVTYSVYLPDLSIKASNFKAKRNTFTYINCSGSYFVHWLKLNK